MKDFKKLSRIRCRSSISWDCSMHCDARSLEAFISTQHHMPLKAQFCLPPTHSTLHLSVNKRIINQAQYCRITQVTAGENKTCVSGNYAVFLHKRTSERARGGMRECNVVVLYSRHVIETCFPRLAVVVFCFSTSFACREYEDSLAFLLILGLVSLQPRPMNN